MNDNIHPIRGPKDRRVGELDKAVLMHCLSNRCGKGNRECPTPQACLLAECDREYKALTRLYRIAVALVIAAGLIAIYMIIKAIKEGVV